MALHGWIEVNRQPIGAWSATRQAMGPDPDGTAEYRWNATMYADDPPAVFTGLLRHRIEDGALALAMAVLTAAHEQRRALADSPQSEIASKSS